eukprot:3151634-Prorocentrum_lima.AAC.1
MFSTPRWKNKTGKFENPPYAYVADVMRHNSTGRLRSQPVSRPGPKKALEPRGQVGRYLCSQSWTNKEA